MGEALMVASWMGWEGHVEVEYHCELKHRN